MLEKGERTCSPFQCTFSQHLNYSIPTPIWSVDNAPLLLLLIVRALSERTSGLKKLHCVVNPLMAFIAAAALSALACDELLSELLLPHEL